jgi:hypothetical protein
MSVKQIPVYIEAKYKIHDNLGHKEHSTHTPHPNGLLLNLPHILTLPTPNRARQIFTSNHKRPGKCEKRGVSCIGSNISALQQLISIY